MMKACNTKKMMFWISLVGLGLLLNHIETALIYLSVEPNTPFFYEPSGVQLLYPLTIGFGVNLLCWIGNFFAYRKTVGLCWWRQLPLLLIALTTLPLLSEYVGLLSLPAANHFLYSYGWFLLCCSLIIVGLMMQALCCSKKK